MQFVALPVLQERNKRWGVVDVYWEMHVKAQCAFELARCLD